MSTIQSLKETQQRALEGGKKWKRKKGRNAYIRVKKIQECALVRRISLHIDIHFFLTPLLLPKIPSKPTSTNTMRYSKIPLRQILRLPRPHSIINCSVLVPPRVQSCHVDSQMQRKPRSLRKLQTSSELRRLDCCEIECWVGCRRRCCCCWGVAMAGGGGVAMAGTCVEMDPLGGKAVGAKNCTFIHCELFSYILYFHPITFALWAFAPPLPCP